MNMWKNIIEKIKLLRSMDKTNQLFGSEIHKYTLNPVVNDSEIHRIEALIGFKLPSELVGFYTNVGNGVAGPHYGLLTLEELSGFNPDKEYQGSQYFKDIAESNGELSDDGYFEVDRNKINGLVKIINEGCGHDICMVVKGDSLGCIVHLSCDGCLYDTEKTLSDLYNEWLYDGITAFEEIQKLVESKLSMDEIHIQFQEKLKRYDADSLAASFIGAEKPAQLFGSGNHKIYHGATQKPWYEMQLANYRTARV